MSASVSFLSACISLRQAGASLAAAPWAVAGCPVIASSRDAGSWSTRTMSLRSSLSVAGFLPRVLTALGVEAGVASAGPAC